MQPREQKDGNWRTKIAVITLNECCSFLNCSLCVTSCITKKYLHRCAQHAIILMEWHVKFKGTRAPWPASRLSCSHPLHGRMHLPGDYLHRLIAVSIRRERRNFFASYKGAAVSEAERKKREKRKAGRKKWTRWKEFVVSYCRPHNGARNPWTEATVFFCVDAKIRLI